MPPPSATADTARQPFRSPTWTAALTVIADRDRGNVARTRRLVSGAFTGRTKLTGQGRPGLRLARLRQAVAARLASATDHAVGHRPQQVTSSLVRSTFQVIDTGPPQPEVKAPGWGDG